MLLSLKRITMLMIMLYSLVQHNHGNFTFRNFNISDGLPDNIVRAIAQDEQQFIWLGTHNGLSKFDGVHFSIYRNNPADSTTLINNSVSVLKSVKGGLLIGSEGGLDYYSIATNSFQRSFIKDREGNFHTFTRAVRDILQIENKIYVLLSNGRLLGSQSDFIFEEIVIENQLWASITAYNNYLVAHNPNGIYLIDTNSKQIISNNKSTNNNTSESIYFSKNQNLLFVAYGIGKATEAYQITYNNKIERININLPGYAYRIMDYKDMTLFGTNGKGLFVLKDDELVDYNTQNCNIASDVIYAMFEDNKKNLFIGTYRYGIDFYSESHSWFEVFTPNNKKISDKIVAAVAIQNNKIYIGLDGGGLNIYDKNTRKTEVITTKNSKLPGDNIISISYDKDYIWLGEYMQGLCRLSLSDKQLKHFPLPENSMLWTIKEMGDDEIWVIGRTVMVFNKVTEEYNIIEELRNKWASDIVLINDTVWISTAFSGIYKLERKTKNIIGRLTQKTSEHPLADNNIAFIYADSNGNIWFSPLNLGLCKLDHKTQQITHYNSSNGLYDLNIMAAEEDKEGYIWFSSNNGLYRYSPTADAFIRYGNRNNLPSTQFNHKASFKNDNKLFFGSTNGLIFFDTKEIGFEQTINPIYFQNIHILKTNQYVYINDTIYSKPLKLPYDHNFLTINFTTPEYSFPGKVRFSYKMINFQDEWRDIGDERKLSITNIPPGKYEVRIRQMGVDGTWSNHYSSLPLTILPPWWRTDWAISIWVLLTLALIVAAYLLYLREERINQLAKKREMEKNIERRNNEIKLRFFTNISHEFRTPLSLIITPLDIIVKNEINPALKNKLKNIHKNAENLLELVNQLLDFRKLETSGEKLNLTYGDIIEYAATVINAYTDKVQNEHKELSLSTNSECIHMFFDKDKLRKVLNNLFSNAIKFTQPGSQIILNIQKTIINNVEHAQLTISDNGIGIPPDKLPFIFDRFYKFEHNPEMQSGSGIGLHLVKEYVNLHAGSVSVVSTWKKGTTFTILIPTNLKPADVTIPEKETECEKEYIELQPIRNHKKSILIVEDNVEFRQFLVEQLENEFYILEANNGQEGESIASSKQPSLVITDITMPVMDGVELCKRLKNNIQTSHIPIILLTARASNEFVLSGYEAGADEYISKPFNFDILVLQIRKLIKQQEEREKYFKKTIDIKPVDITITSLDEKLIKDALASIEKNMNNSDFSVDELSVDVGLSRTSLFQKIQSITSLTPLNFIRSVRLKRAAQLLRDSDLNISEIADYVGFGSIKYFNIHFKEEFEVTPTTYRKNTKQQIQTPE
jgi:signal transduction histidine kinase/DNA-binding response OmpR family regulator/ligand-binding sensor domain-containing protein